MTKKINAQGQFLPFAGISVISMISDDVNLVLWQQLYNYLQSNNEITSHYGLLPFDSYHMTTNSLKIKGNTSSAQWHNFLINNQGFFQNLNHSLLSNNLQPLIMIRTDKVNMNNVIQLMLQVPVYQSESIRKVSKSLNIEQSISYPLHITLAYQKCPISLQLKDNLKHKIQQKITELFSNKTIKLKPATLCTFNTIEKFMPWNGRYSPSLFPDDVNTPLLSQASSSSSQNYSHINSCLSSHLSQINDPNFAPSTPPRDYSQLPKTDISPTSVAVEHSHPANAKPLSVMPVFKTSSSVYSLSIFSQENDKESEHDEEQACKRHKPNNLNHPNS